MAGYLLTPALGVPRHSQPRQAALRVQTKSRGELEGGGRDPPCQRVITIEKDLNKGRGSYRNVGWDHIPPSPAEGKGVMIEQPWPTAI